MVSFSPTALVSSLLLILLASAAAVADATATDDRNIRHREEQWEFEDHQAFQRRLLRGNADDENMVQQSYDFAEHLRRAQVTCNCVEEVDGDFEFFDITVELEPQDASRTCDSADQNMLGHDINVLLLNYGVGEAGDDDDIVFLASVCSEPATHIRRKLRQGYGWTGAGACSGCHRDNRDQRRRNLVGSDWFTNTAKPQMESTLQTAILNDLVPNHHKCLGSNPSINVNVVGVQQSDIDDYCGTSEGGAIPVLNTIGHSSWALDGGRSRCDACIKIDFETDGNGNPLPVGGWLPVDEFVAAHGLRISAHGGGHYSRNPNEARLFDTSNPYIAGLGGDLDLGSPNEKCPNAGPGIGHGGEPGMPGENCEPLGNVLIIQENNEHPEIPDDNLNGGKIKFQFSDPVLFSDIGFMDSDSPNQKLHLTYTGNRKSTFTYDGYGEGSVQRVIANKYDVKEVIVEFAASGAVTEINFCPNC